MDEQTALVFALQLTALSCIAGSLLLYLVWKVRRPQTRGDTGGKSVLVTAASTQLGLECGLALAKAGFRVFAGCPEGVESHAAQILRAKLKSLEADGVSHGAVVILPLDCTREDSLHEAVQHVRRHLPAGQNGLWAVVNTAGWACKGRLELQESAAWDLMFRVNVVATLRTARALLPLLRLTKGKEGIPLQARKILQSIDVVVACTCTGRCQESTGTDQCRCKLRRRLWTEEFYELEEESPEEESIIRGLETCWENKRRLVTIGLTGECCGSYGSGAVAYSAARHAVAGASAALRNELATTPVSVVVADVPRVRAESLYRPVRPRKENDPDALTNYRSDTLPQYVLNGLEEVLLCGVPKERYELRPPMTFSNLFRVRRKSNGTNTTV